MLIRAKGVVFDLERKSSSTGDPSIVRAVLSQPQMYSPTISDDFLSLILAWKIYSREMVVIAQNIIMCLTVVIANLYDDRVAITMGLFRCKRIQIQIYPKKSSNPNVNVSCHSMVIVTQTSTIEDPEWSLRI